MKRLVYLSLLAMCLVVTEPARAANVEISTEQQRAAVRQFVGLYSALNRDQRAMVLPLIAQAINSNLPVRDEERGLEVRSFRAMPNETVAMRVRWLHDLEAEATSKDDLQGMLPMVVRGLGCKDASITQLIRAGIRIQVDIESLKGQDVASTVLDTNACKAPDSIEDHLKSLGAD